MCDLQIQTQTKSPKSALIMDLQALKKRNILDGIVMSEIQPVGNFLVSPYYAPYVEGILVPNGFVKTRVEQIANEIMDFYRERPYTIICILKGSIVVFNELLQKITDTYNLGKYKNNVNYEFVKISSYINDTSSGKVNISGLSELNLEGKEILVVEDIVDTGLTMENFLLELKQGGVKSVKIFSLLLKEGKTKFPFAVDHVGFIVPDQFIVGFGIDYNQQFRDLPHICVINSEGIEKFRKTVEQ